MSSYVLDLLTRQHTQLNPQITKLDTVKGLERLIFTVSLKEITTRLLFLHILTLSFSFVSFFSLNAVKMN